MLKWHSAEMDILKFQQKNKKNKKIKNCFFLNGIIFLKKVDTESMFNIWIVAKKRNDSSNLIFIFVKPCGS